MDTPNLPPEDTSRLPVSQKQGGRPQSVWSVPLESALTAFLNNRDAVGRFLGLTGGSVLYGLSALSVVYGITQIVGPPLAKSGALADILPCVAVLNVYELALLAVLGLIVVWRKVTTIPVSLGIEVISYPPVVLGLTGLALLWLGSHRRASWLRFVALAYALGVLLTMSRDHEFNLWLFGGGLIIVLLTIGAILRNVHLCFAGVIAATVGLGTTDALAAFARTHDLTTAGAMLGVGALGLIAVTLAFGRRTPAAYVLLGTLSAMACIFDYLPKSLHWVDLVVVLAIALLFAALLWRTRNVAPALVLWIPVFPRTYLLMARMSSWNFVVLGFLLLLLGALVSLFLKQKLLAQRPGPVEPTQETGDLPSDGGT